MFFLIILAVGAFLIFSQRRGLPPGGPSGQPDSGVETEAPDSRGEHTEYGSPRGGDFAGRKKMPTGETTSSSDWSIGDAATSPRATGSSDSHTQRKGDWSIDSDPEDKTDDNQFRFSQSTESDTPLKTSPAEQGGDWSMDTDPEKKKKPVESGDWKLE